MELGLYGKNVLGRHSCRWVHIQNERLYIIHAKSHDEQPLYIFDKKFVEKSQKQTLHNGIDRDVSFDYSVPEFSEMKMTCFLSLEVNGGQTIGGLLPDQLAPDLVFTLIQMVQMLGMLSFLVEKVDYVPTAHCTTRCLSF